MVITGVHADVQHKAHRRHHPATSAPLPAGAGRGRAAGKGPVNAVSASSGGQLATSATPSGAASHTHVGQLSSGARAPHDARSTLPALVGPNSSSAAAAPAGALATTATVGAAAGSGTADRRVRVCLLHLYSVAQPTCYAVLDLSLIHI